MKNLTKSMIADNFIELLKTNTIEKITIKMLSEKCDINRQTFYYHFRDIYDLMEWTLWEHMQDYLKEYGSPDDDWLKTLQLLFDYLSSRRNLILNGYDTYNRVQYERFIQDHLRDIFQDQIDKFPRIDEVPEESADFVCTVYTLTVSELLIEWVESSMPTDYKDQLELYYTMFDGALTRSLTAFIKKNEDN